MKNLKQFYLALSLTIISLTVIFNPTASPAYANPTGNIVYAERVSPGFVEKVIAIGLELDINPNHLMAAMAFETGGTFSPSKKNAAGSGATGLIQFMPSTARDLDTTVEALAAMSAEAQLGLCTSLFSACYER